MRHVTAGFDPTVSHTIAVRATLLSTGDELPVEGGSVTLHSNAEVRATADLLIADDGTLGWIPTTADSPLLPFGQEIQIERGIQDEDGETELVSIAIVRIEQVQISDSGGDLTLQVTGLDRSAMFIDAQFEAPYQITGGTNVIDAITKLLTDADPNVEFAFPTIGYSTPLLIAEEGGNRWEVAQGLATWIGHELYFDGDGIAVITPVAQTTPAVLEIAEGEDGLLIEANANWDREQAFNRVVVTGENAGETGVIPRGVATDDDYQSPTYYYGPGISGEEFGKKPMFFASEFVRTKNQAEGAAKAKLLQNLGIGKTINFGSVVHPALEPLDAISVTRERLGIESELLIVDELTIPLDASGVMTGTCRSIRVF